MAAVERWVLDTNAVLDWLVFDDPGMRAGGARLHAAQARWLHTRDMLDELDDVLGRPLLLRRAGAPAQALRQRVAAASAAHGGVVPPAARCRWHCDDADDQMFVDLAAQASPCWLFTRDKALLALARAAAAAGVRIVRPADWARGSA